MLHQQYRIYQKSRGSTAVRIWCGRDLYIRKTRDDQSNPCLIHCVINYFDPTFADSCWDRQNPYTKILLKLIDLAHANGVIKLYTMHINT